MDHKLFFILFIFIFIFYIFYNVIIEILPSKKADSGKNQFTYDNSEKWNDEYRNCESNNQSPINIITSQISYANNSLFTLNNLDSMPTNMTLSNTGATIILRASFPQNSSVSFQIWNRNYKFDQISFHWGTNNSDGSEHAVDGKKYAAEMQMSFFSDEFQTYEEAFSDPNGVAMISFLLRANDTQNEWPNLAKYVEKISEIGNEITISEDDVFSLDRFDSLIEVEHFFRYPGSMTQPPCLPVLWIISVNAINIPMSVLESFRNTKLRGGAKKNARALQPLNNRTVSSATKSKLNREARFDDDASYF